MWLFEKYLRASLWISSLYYTRANTSNTIGLAKTSWHREKLLIELQIQIECVNWGSPKSIDIQTMLVIFGCDFAGQHLANSSSL